jgi:DNA polymerase-4
MTYTSDVVPKSIDEFVISFKGSEALRQGRSLDEVGYEIKERIREHVGDYVSVNVGIGTNRFLAKLASGLHKPDGLDVITHDNLLQTLGSVELMALPGINRRFKARLQAAGIGTPLEMYAADAKFLKNFVFFSKLGYDWHMRLRGWEVDEVEFERRTIGHQYALKEKTHDRDQLCRLLMKLCEKTGRRLRKNDLVAGGVHLSLGFTNRQYWHHGHKTEAPLYATQEIYRAAADMLLGIGQFPDNVSAISITVFNLRPRDPEQLGLFEEAPLRRRRLAEAADGVNDHFGEFTMVPAIMADMQKVVLDRISFGGIRDMDDQLR